jgi:hypothetical protein|tara:strand:+ start:3252 stop:3692 length:441 start_codon:yes stop_codon:yes gene_type:complete
MIRESIADTITAAGKLKTAEEKVVSLQSNVSVALRTILRLIYDKEINFLIPDSAPPYKENGAIENTETMLYREARRMKIFIEGGGYDNLNQVKREGLFISLLEDLHPSDSKMIVENVITQKPMKGVSRKTVEQAFPDLFTTPMDMS